MHPRNWLAHWRVLDPWMRGAICVYLLLTAITCTRSALAPTRQSVYPIWQLAGHDWLTSHDLYDHSKDADPIRWGFRYPPLCAALLTVCDLVPMALGGVVFRLVSVGFFVVAVEWWLRLGLPVELTAAQRGIAHLLIVPFALGSLNNAQFNLVLIAFMLVAVLALHEQRWNLAAFCLAGAIVLKVYPVALAALLVMVYPRRLGLRLVFALLVLALLPFLMQEPGYVVRQYQLWYAKVGHGDLERRHWPLGEGYRDLWLIFRAWELPVSVAQYTRLQLAGAGVCALLTAIAWLRWKHGKELLFAVLGLATSWMILLGPAPESCTYVLIAPSLAVVMLGTSRERYAFAHYATVFGYGLLAFCFAVGIYSRTIRLYPGTGLQPFGALVFCVGFLWFVVARLVRPAGERVAERPQTESLRRAA